MASSETLGELNAVTETVQITGGRFSVGLYSASSFVGTVAVQRRRVGTATWRTVSTYTAEVEESGEMPGTWEARLIVTAYTSGSIIGEISA